jgi:hypothetical protein
MLQPMRLPFLFLCISLLLGTTTIVQAATDSLGGGLARPAPEAGPTPVRIGFFILDLSRVDDVLQEFVIDFRLEVRWYDSRVVTVEEAPERAGELLSLEEVWHPSLTLVNQRRIWARLPEQVVIQSDGSLAYGQRYYGSFAAPLDLRDFPLDEQIVRIVSGSKRYGVDELEFLPFERLMGSLGKSTLPNWEVGEGRFESTAIGIPSFGKQFSAAIYEIPLKRGSGYFVWKVVLPLCLIVAMSWAVFWIDPRELGSQLGLSASAVLTLVAFQWSLGQFLPRVSYMTTLDHFLIVSMIFVFLALGEAITSTRFALRGHSELAFKLDRVCRIAFPVSFCTIVGLIFLF